MIRITPDKVKVAYQVCGLTPVRANWLNTNRRKCCGMSACLLAAGDITLEDTYQSIRPKAEEKFGEEYSKGFALGFDNHPADFSGDIQTDNFKLGYTDGVECAKELFDNNGVTI